MSATNDIVVQISTTGVTPTYVGRVVTVNPLGNLVHTSGKNVDTQVPITTFETLYSGYWKQDSVLIL